MVTTYISHYVTEFTLLSLRVPELSEPSSLRIFTAIQMALETSGIALHLL